MSKVATRLIAPVIFIYFLYFAIPALQAKFAPDDMMNLGKYWIQGIWSTWWDDLRLSNGQRPMGAFFYLPIYHFFGLNPIPYRIAIFAILAANLFFTFKIAERLTKSQAVAALAAVLVCGHASMVAIYYSTSMIYDVLAYFFTAAMLYSYIAFRRDGKNLTFGQSALVVVLYIAAIKSKEIAVVGAGWILAYEMLFHRPRKLRVPLILIVIAILSAAATLLSPHALSRQEGYLLELTPHRYVVNHIQYVNDLFYLYFFNSGRQLLVAWLVLTAACAIARRRDLWWCWFAVSTGTLPVAFTIQPRGGSSLYVPLLAVAILVSIFVVGFFKRPAAQWSAAAAAAFLFTLQTVPLWRHNTPAYIEDHRLTWSVISQFRGLPQRPAPNSRVIVLSNPFADWDVLFIAALTWHDHSIDVKLANKLDAPPVLADYNWVLTFEGEELRVVRAR
jgi:hypothetical protein